MADEDISAKLTADASDLNDNINTAADAVTEAMERMAGAVEKAAEALEKSLGEGAEHAKHNLHEAGEEAESFGEKLEGIKNSLEGAWEATGILVIAEAFEKVAGSVEEAMEAGTQFMNQSEVLGITVEQYQRLAEAAKEAGVSQGKVSRVAIKLKIDLDEARQGVSGAIDKLNQLGLTNWADPMMDENKLLEELGARLRDTATAGDTMAAFQKEFSSRMAMAAEVLKVYNGEDKKWYDASTQDAERLHEMHKFWTDVGDGIAGATRNLILFLDRKVDLAADDQGNLVGSEPKGEGGEGEEKKKEAEKANEATDEMSEKAKKKAVETAAAEVAATKSGTEARVAAVEKYLEAVEAYYSTESEAYKKAQAELVKAKEAASEAASKAAEKSAEAELKAAEKTLNLHESQLRKTTEQMTKAWDEYFEQFIKKDNEMAKGAAETAEAQAKSAQVILEAQLKANQISPGTWATAYIATIHNVEDAQVAMYQSLRAGADGNVAVMQEMDNKIAAAHAKAQTEIIAASMKASKQVETDWEKSMKPIGDAFGKTFDEMILHQQKFSQAFRNLETQLVTSFVHSMGQMLSHFITSQLAQTAAHRAGTEARAADDQTATNQSMVMSAMASLKKITNAAASAAAGAYDAMASIPYVGPVLGALAAAATFVAVEAFGASVASAEGGMVLDSDQLVSAHEDEMILPAHISQGIQERILSPQGDNSSESGGSRNTYHIQAHDAASFDKFLRKHSSRNSMMRALQKANRNGNRAGAR